MSLRPPPIRSPIHKEGYLPQVWTEWFTRLQQFIGFSPFPLSQYTVASLPDAAANTATLIYVSDEAGGAIPCFSDGTNWRRMSDRAVVS